MNLLIFPRRLHERLLIGRDEGPFATKFQTSRAARLAPLKSLRLRLRHARSRWGPGWDNEALVGAWCLVLADELTGLSAAPTPGQGTIIC